ncbi:hypothetical protein [Salinibaculum marinum]|uniref:hypothetical protein n=1 Tax=Salinibaculum marinum TaxID=3131993 RepID=UPI0030D2889D
MSADGRADLRGPAARRYLPAHHRAPGAVARRPEDDADDVEAGETVYATDPEPDGEQTVENVPMPGDRPDVEGQSTFEDWRWSA